MSTVDDARQMLTAGDAERAVRELEQAASQGDCSSWLELGFLFLAGHHVTRDLTRARECFFRAGEAGNSSGRRIYIQLLAIGAGAQPNWPEAVNALRDLAASDALAARQMELLGRMALAPSGDPAREIPSRELSAEPQVWSFDRLFSAEESAYLIERAQPNLEPSVIVDPQTGQMREHPVRTSHNMSFVWVSEDLVIHALNRRIAAASGTAVSVGEPLQILRYSPGQQFHPHFDAFDSTDNQRVLTMLVYLNENYEGGQTVFTHNGLTFRGRTGDGLLFRNALADGRRDESAQHAGLPVTAGEKWLASRWIRERPLVAT